MSLLLAVAKVLNAIQSKRFSSFLVKNKLLYVLDTWLQIQNKGSTSVGVFPDFQKAFDKVEHKGLLFKLACCGVSHDALSWFESYLLNRAITARVESTYSSTPHPISTGIPQGSHLGPILFAVFINGLTSAVQKSQTELYADDTLIHKAISKDIIPQGMHSLQTSVPHLLGPSPGEAISLPPRLLFFPLATLPWTCVSNSPCLLMKKISTLYPPKNRVLQWPEGRPRREDTKKLPAKHHVVQPSLQPKCFHQHRLEVSLHPDQQAHFHKGSKLNKIFNRNTLKLRKFYKHRNLVLVACLTWQLWSGSTTAPCVCKARQVFFCVSRYAPALIFANQQKKKCSFRFSAWNPNTKCACPHRYCQPSPPLDPAPAGQRLFKRPRARVVEQHFQRIKICKKLE